MTDHNPELVRAWNDYAVPLGPMTPDEAVPLWYAFKAGWDARFKHDLAMEKEAGCDHCWHDTGMVLASLPPQYQKRCCRCGEVENYRGQILSEDYRVHGPFRTGFVL